MSSAQAKLYHSITIGDKNTWDDWHLVPTSRPLVNPPEVKESYLEIPGGDGVLDLTTSLTSKPQYRHRTGTWQFIVITDYDGVSHISKGRWATLFSDMMAYLHGKKHRVILDDDPNYYYEGRFSVSGWSSSPSSGYSTVAINYVLYPYKTSVSDSGDMKL